MKIKTKKEIVAFTSTIPVEIIFAANKIPLDLNNIFVSSKNPNRFIEIAENKGFPRNFCAWTKGLFGIILKNKSKIKYLIAIMEGDCSSNHSLFEYIKTFKINKNNKNLINFGNLKLINFAYPLNKNPKILKKNIEDFMKTFNVNWTQVMKIHKKLNEIRKKILKFDELFYFASNFSNKDLENKNFDNKSYKKLLKKLKNIDLHIWQISCTDFLGDYKKFEKNFDEFWKKNDFEKYYQYYLETKNTKNRIFKNEKNNSILRLGFLGVPTIIPEIYKFLDEKYYDSVKVIYNEMQREFSFIKNIFSKKDYKSEKNFKKKYIKQYLDYSYPYFVKYRIFNAKNEIKAKNIDAFIHYTQSFCHKQVDDFLFRENLYYSKRRKNRSNKFSILTIEEDRPLELSQRTKIRLEAFISVCKNKNLILNKI